MEGGGVEKNLILIANYISKFENNIQLITFDNTFNKFFNKKITILNAVKKKSKNYSKYYKYFYCLCILIKQYFKSKNFVLFTFQANIYALTLSYLLKFRVISRSNSSPSGWGNNFFKNIIFNFFFTAFKIVIFLLKNLLKVLSKVIN